MALNNFEGGVVLVSHDERLISLVVDEIWQVKKGDMTKNPPEPGHVKVFNGSFEEYKEMLRKEFEGGSLLSNKKKAERRERELAEKAAKKNGVRRRGRAPPPPRRNPRAPSRSSDQRAAKERTRRASNRRPSRRDETALHHDERHGRVRSRICEIKPRRRT